MGSTRLSVDVPHLVDLYQHQRLKLDELISARYPLEQINEAIESTEKGGALRNQFYVGGHFNLADDEVYVVRVQDGGAAYFVVPLANVWGTTMDIVDRTSSLNKAQSVPDGDGAYTYVLSPEDPGVHNWLDTCGLREGMLTLRMAEFPGGKPRDDLEARGEVVKKADLKAYLSDTTTWVDAAARKRQQEERAHAYLRRLPEASR